MDDLKVVIDIKSLDIIVITESYTKCDEWPEFSDIKDYYLFLLDRYDQKDGGVMI